MPDRHTPEERLHDPRQAELRLDKEILAVMLDDVPLPWSVDELARELGDPLGSIDAIRRLSDHGLVHRLGDFVFPTRTARRAAEIEIGT